MAWEDAGRRCCPGAERGAGDDAPRRRPGDGCCPGAEREAAPLLCPWGSRFGDVTSGRIVRGGLARIELGRIPSRWARTARGGVDCVALGSHCASRTRPAPVPGPGISLSGAGITQAGPAPPRPGPPSPPDRKNTTPRDLTRRPGLDRAGPVSTSLSPAPGRPGAGGVFQFAGPSSSPPAPTRGRREPGPGSTPSRLVPAGSARSPDNPRARHLTREHVYQRYVLEGYPAISAPTRRSHGPGGARCRGAPGPPTPARKTDAEVVQLRGAAPARKTDAHKRTGAGARIHAGAATSPDLPPADRSDLEDPHGCGDEGPRPGALRRSPRGPARVRR